MLSTKARPITRREYSMIPVGAPNQQLIEGDRMMAPSSGLYHQEIAGRLHRAGLTIDLANVFAA